MQLTILNLSIDQKLAASYLAISLCVILSCMLAIHNIALNAIEMIKFFCKIDYFHKYYEAEYV